MHNLEKGKTEQQQLEQILNQTFPNSNYCDEDITQFIHDPAGNYENMFNVSQHTNAQDNADQEPTLRWRKNSSRSKSSRKLSEQSEQLGHNSRALTDQLSDQLSQLNSYGSDQQNSQQDASPYIMAVPRCLESLQSYYNGHREVPALQQIKQRYPNFLVSQPVYNIGKTYSENVFEYNNNIINSVNITCMDIAYCCILQAYRIVLGTHDAKVLVFERTYTKPVQIYEVFAKPAKKAKKDDNKDQQIMKKQIKYVKWSQNLQYLAICSNQQQLKVYQFKQQIKIQDNIILRNQKQPVQLFSVSKKQLKSSIKQLKFISQSPLCLIFNDDNDDIQLLDYKLHFINYKVYINKLDIKFFDVFTFDIMDFGNYYDKNKKYKNHNKEYIGDNEKLVNNKYGSHVQQTGTLLAISSENYVTLCLVKPHFEIIMVYDKEKHGKNIKKQGYAQIEFRKQPQLGLLIVWDKYAHIINIHVQSVNPLQTKISNLGSLLLPETTYCAGLITNSLLYQLSQSGIKIYSVDNFKVQQKQCLHYTQHIYSRQVKFMTLPNSRRILQILGDVGEGEAKGLSLEGLCMFRNIVKSCEGELFLTSCCQLFGVKVEDFEAFIRNTIENINNWKIGLQLLCDSYKGMIKSYNNMSKERITKLLQQYSQKYINFLLVIIGNTGPANTTQQSLWVQQTTFLFNILIQTHQYTFLFNKILPKLCSLTLQKYIYSLEPFILLQRIPIVTATGLQILFEYMRAQISNSMQGKQDTDNIDKSQNHNIISRLIIGGLRVQQNQADLPHQINGILLENGMYEQIVCVNVAFGDYLTPFVILVSRYQKINAGNNSVAKNDMQVLLQLKMKNSRSQSEKSEQQKVVEPSQQGQKQRLRQMVLYLTNYILLKINKSKCQQSQKYISPQQKREQLHYKQFLQIFIPLLQNSIINMLLDNSQCQSALFQLVLPQLFSGKCLQIINYIDNKKFNVDLMTDIVNGVNLARVSKIKEYWVCAIGLYNLSVVKIEVFMGVRYLVHHQQELVAANKYQQLRKLEQFMAKTVHESSHKLRQQMEQLSHPLLEQFYTQLLNSQMSHTQSHIGLLVIISQLLGQGYYCRVVLAIMSFRPLQQQDHLPKAKNKNVKHVYRNQFKNRKIEPRYNVYHYLDHNIGKFSNAEKEQFKNIIYENMEYYVQQDSQKLCDIIIQHYLHSIDKFIKYHTTPKRKNSFPVSPTGPADKTPTIDPHVFLTFISCLLHRLQSAAIQQLSIHKFEPHSEWMLEQKLLYLKLLAMTGREKQILEEIKKQSYPLDSSLQICRQYGIIDAEAYLLVKSGGEGEIASAIKLYFELIMDKVKNLTPENVGVFKQYLISIVRECVRVCEALHSAPDHFNEEWFIITQQLYHMKTSIYRILPAYTGDLLCDIIEKELYPILSEKIVRKQPPQGIIPYLHANMQNLDLIFIRSLLREVLKNNAYQKSIFLLAQETFIENQIQQRKLITKKSLNGEIIKFQCSICHEHASDAELIIHYNSCKHQIHPSCGQDVKNCYICAFRVERMVERQFDIIRKIKPELVCKEREEQELQKNQVRKLTYIEKLKKFEQEVVDIDYRVEF